MKNTACILFFVFLLEVSILAQTETIKITPPKKISHNGKTYLYDTSWRNKEIYIETNLDKDQDKEIIIAFMGYFKPEKEIDNETPEPFKRKKNEIVIIEHQAFYQIYDKGPDGYYEQIKTLTGMDQPGRIEIVKLDTDHAGAIAIYSPGGHNYLDLSIYLWQEGGYRLIFNHGGTQNLRIDSSKQPVTIVDKKEKQADENVIFTWTNGFL